jgi:hypothetical protein
MGSMCPLYAHDTSIITKLAVFDTQARKELQADVHMTLV